MSYNVKYKSSNGEEFDLLTFEGLKIKEANFHKYKWSANFTGRNFGGILTGFSREPTEFEIKFYFRGNLKNRKDKIEKFHFCTEYDVLHETPGRIIWGDDYIDGFFIAVDTQPVEDGGQYTEDTTTFLSLYPAWIEEKKVTIHPNETTPGPDDHKGYPENRSFSYPYKYSYSLGENATNVEIDHYSSSNFKLTVYGPAENVNLTIAGHTYSVNYPLLSNQYMVIDSRPTTKPEDRCYVVKADGEKVNTFDYRNPAHSIFEPIPPGNFVINYPREYGIELIIYIERSEPRCKSLYS